MILFFFFSLVLLSSVYCLLSTFYCLLSVVCSLLTTDQHCPVPTLICWPSLEHGRLILTSLVMAYNQPLKRTTTPQIKSLSRFLVIWRLAICVQLAMQKYHKLRSFPTILLYLCSTKKLSNQFG